MNTGTNNMSNNNIMLTDGVNNMISNNNNSTMMMSDGSFLAPSTQIAGATSNNTFIRANGNMNGNVNMIAAPSMQQQVQQVQQQPIQSFLPDQQYSAQIISIPTPM